jgi:large subunit ribosomal protein L20
MRVKGGVNSRRKHKRLLQRVKGYRQARSKIHKVAKEAYLHAGQYSTAGRRRRAGDMRSLWILRLNAALREKGFSYSKFINELSKAKIDLNRKMLSELAINEPQVFTKLVEKIKA